MLTNIKEDSKDNQLSIQDYKKPLNPLDPKNSIKPVFTYFYLIYQHMILIPSWTMHILMLCSLYMNWVMMEGHFESDDWIVSMLKPIPIRRFFLWVISLMNIAILGHFGWVYKNRHIDLSRKRIFNLEKFSIWYFVVAGYFRIGKYILFPLYVVETIKNIICNDMNIYGDKELYCS